MYDTPPTHHPTWGSSPSAPDPYICLSCTRKSWAHAQRRTILRLNPSSYGPPFLRRFTSNITVNQCSPLLLPPKVFEMIMCSPEVVTLGSFATLAISRATTSMHASSGTTAHSREPDQGVEMGTNLGFRGLVGRPRGQTSKRYARQGTVAPPNATVHLPTSSTPLDTSTNSIQYRRSLGLHLSQLILPTSTGSGKLESALEPTPPN